MEKSRSDLAQVRNMICFTPFWKIPNPKILLLGAHPDDIEIGCGGTILRITKETPDAQCHWVVFSGNSQRREEAQKSATSFLKDCNKKKIIIENFRDSFFPFEGSKIKEYFEKLKSEFSPDIILTHYSNDAHQDHRLISDLTWNTFRNQLILEYELPKYDGDIGHPNVFVNLEGKYVTEKIDNICSFFQSQQNKQWFDKETFRAILRLRGIECNASSKLAEAFYCKKAIM